MEHTLSVSEQRRVLNSFLEDADDEKVERMFSFFMSSILDEEADGDAKTEQLAEVFRRRDAYFRGEIKGHPWREIMERLKKRDGGLQ